MIANVADKLADDHRYSSRLRLRENGAKIFSKLCLTPLVGIATIEDLIFADDSTHQRWKFCVLLGTGDTSLDP